MTGPNRSNQSVSTNAAANTSNMASNIPHYRLPSELGNVQFNISTQGSRKDRYCKAVTITLQDFADDLAKPRVKPETHAQYLAMNREDQTNSKDVGGFVLGTLRKGLRNKNTVENLCGVALDADFAQPGMIDTIRYTMPYVTIVYSTRKHTPEKPRYRIIFMLKHPVSPEQHAAIARKLAEHIGIEMFDKTTFEPNRMMFFPSISSDGKFEFEVFGRELCDPDAVLAEYDDWRDSSKWPICPEEKRMVSGVVPSKQKDPLGKDGVIGAYNKTHTITRVLEEYGGELYEPAAVPNRWSYKQADSTAGVVIYEDKFFYSFHASDPNSCQLMNAFDLTRVLKFSDQDENSRDTTATTKLPSYKAMVAFARDDEEVKMMLAEQKAEKARMTFAAVEDDLDDSGDDENHAGNTDGNNDDTADTADTVVNADAGTTANASTAVGSPSAESGTAEDGKDSKSGKDSNATNTDGKDASTSKKKPNNAWKRKLEYDNMGNLKGSMYNAMLIFHNDENLAGIVFNELTESLEIQGQVPWDHPSEMWRDQDDSQLIAYLELNYGSFSERIYKNALAKIADDRRYHPIRDYLNALPAWDGVPRVDRLLVSCLGAADTPYVHAVTRKTLVAAVARVMNPGTKFDTILVMIGPQGCGKSTLVARLAQKWFNDSLMLTDTKDRTAPEKLQGYWILELGELAGLRKSDLETLKGFISRQNDIFRAAYGRRSTPHMRQCIFVGTTNAEHGFLRDTTGNRRFWPVTVPGYNPDYVPAEMKDSAADDTAITAGSVESMTSVESAPSADVPTYFHKRSWELTQTDVDQIWAEVLTYYYNKESLILPTDLNEEAVKTQRESMETDDREPLVREYLEKLLPENWYNLETAVRINYLNGGEFAGAKMVGTMKRKRVCNMEIWTECFGNTSSKIGRQDSNQIIAMMERIPGWVRSPKKARIKPYGIVPVYVRDPNYRPGESCTDEYGTDGYGAGDGMDEFDEAMD